MCDMTIRCTIRCTAHEMIRQYDIWPVDNEADTLYDFFFQGLIVKRIVLPKPGRHRPYDGSQHIKRPIIPPR